MIYNVLSALGVWQAIVSKLSIQKMCCVRLQNRLDSSQNRLDCDKNWLDSAQNRLNWKNRLDFEKNRLDCDKNRLKIDLIVINRLDWNNRLDSAQNQLDCDKSRLDSAQNRLRGRIDSIAEGSTQLLKDWLEQGRISKYWVEHGTRSSR